MKKIILKESELKEKFSEIYKQEQIKIFEDKWNKLSKNEKIFVIEFLKESYPEKSHFLKEAKWYNTLGDIAGIFDPTGAIDIVNGISYWRQGDKLFALLSWVSAIPYLGDLIAKPVVGAFKIGSKATRAFKSAVIAGDAAKMAGVANKSGGVLKTLLEKVPQWGTTLITMMKRIVNKFPAIRQLIPLVEEYMALFKNASSQLKLVGTEVKGTSKVFRGYKDVGNNWFKYMKSDAPLWHKLNAGSFRLLGGNPATRSLMRRSKWYLGLLDSLGIVNTKTTPEELEKMVPNFEAKLDDYNKSNEGQKNAQEDMTQEQDTETTQTTQTDSEENKKSLTGDLFSALFPQLSILS